MSETLRTIAPLIGAAWTALPSWAQGIIAIGVTGAALLLAALIARALWRYGVRLVAHLRTSAPSGDDLTRLLYETAAPITLGLVILLLAFPGLVHFAEDIAGIRPPLSWLVIVVVEFLALWFAIVRFREAQQDRPAPVAAVMTWVVICVASYLQRTKAQAEGIEDAGVFFLGALPFALGAVVEFALHMRRKRVSDETTEARKRRIDDVLKFHPIEYAQLRIRMAAHPEWSTEEAMTAVRTDRASAILMELREATESPETSIPARPDEADKKAMRRHRKEVATAQRLNAARDARIARLEKKAIRHMTRLGFGGDPSENRAVDLLRSMQVRTRVGEVATLDYTQRGTTLAILGTLVTDADAPGTSWAGTSDRTGTREVTTGVPQAGTTPHPGTSSAVTTPRPESPRTPATEEATTTPQEGAGTAPVPHPGGYPRAGTPEVTDTAQETEEAGTTPTQETTPEEVPQVRPEVPHGYPEGEHTPQPEGGTPQEGTEEAAPTGAGTPHGAPRYPDTDTTAPGAGTPEVPRTPTAPTGTPAQEDTEATEVPESDSGTPQDATEVPPAHPAPEVGAPEDTQAGTTAPQEDTDPDDDGPEGGPAPGETKKDTILRLLTRHHGSAPRVRDIMNSRDYTKTFGATHKAVIYRVRSEHWMPHILRDLVVKFGSADEVLSELDRQGITYKTEKIQELLNDLIDSHENVRPFRVLTAQEGH